MGIFDIFHRSPRSPRAPRPDRSRKPSPQASRRRDDHPSRTIFTGSKDASAYSWLGPYSVDAHAIRDAVRAAMLDSTHLRALVDRLMTNVVNTGLYPEPKPAYQIVGVDDADDRAEWERNTWQRFDMWARSMDATVDRSATFYRAQAMAFWRALVDGEAFVVVRYMSGRDRQSPVSIQFIEPGQVGNPWNGTSMQEIRERGNTVHDGVERDRFRQPVALWVRYQDGFQRIPFYGPKSGRRFVLMYQNLMHPGDPRGVSVFAPVVHELSKITDYSVAEIQAAIANATIAGVIEREMGAESSRPLSGVQRRDQVDATDGYNRTDPPEIATLDTAGVWVQNLNPGEKMTAFNTTRPNVNFGTFVDTVLKSIAASVGVPLEVVLMSFNQNYSASRASLLLFWNAVTSMRAELIDWFLNPIYTQWLVESVAAGEVAAPGINTLTGRRAWARCNWIGINHPSIDPLKEATAASVRIAEGLTTRDREAAAYNGTDFSDNVAELVVENAALADANGPLESLGLDPAMLDGEEDDDE